jgi:hypothetical protein
MWARLRKRIQSIITLTVYVREKMPRAKTIIKRLGETCTIVMCYAPIVLYVYSYVIVDCICNRNAKNCDQWYCSLKLLYGVPPYPPTTRMYVATIWQGVDRGAKVVFDTAAIFWDICPPKNSPRIKLQIYTKWGTDYVWRISFEEHHRTPCEWET